MFITNQSRGNHERKNNFFIGPTQIAMWVHDPDQHFFYFLVFEKASTNFLLENSTFFDIRSTLNF